jgi:2-polyprenyl-3-methyl-5-hydroxy-6-metoxy-1,4-benzoquinol methylase
MTLFKKRRSAKTEYNPPEKTESSQCGKGERFRFETIACPLCKARGFKVLGKKRGHYYMSDSPYENSQIVRCLECGFIYANPMPVPVKDNLNDLYNEDYTQMLWQKNTPYKEVPQDFVDIFEGNRRLGSLESILGRKGRLLDIGCGAGNLLCLAQQKGWEVLGLEINDDSARFAREVNKVEVITGNIWDFKDQWAGQFDAVHFNQVLEHSYDPIEFLTSVKTVMKNDGAVFCGVPNEDNVMNMIADVYIKMIRSDFTQRLSPTFPPYHVLGFSPKTVSSVFRQTGFSVIKIEHVNYCRGIDFQALKNGEILKGIKPFIGMIARLLGHGYGLDVYAVPLKAR